MNPHESGTPPREWFEENFVHDGKVTYCSECQAIPWAFIGHFCTGIEAWAMGVKAEQITVPYRWEDVQPVASDRPGGWMLAWTGPSAFRDERNAS